MLFFPHQDVLAPSCKSGWMSELVSATFKILVELLHDITDFSEDETHVLHSFLSDFLCKTLSIVSIDQQQQKAPDAKLKIVGPEASDWERSVARFANAVDFLELSMVQIVERFCEGSLRHCFSPEEIRHWIRALFSDTQFRETNLSRIV